MIFDTPYIRILRSARKAGFNNTKYSGKLQKLRVDIFPGNGLNHFQAEIWIRLSYSVGLCKGFGIIAEQVGTHIGFACS